MLPLDVEGGPSGGHSCEAGSVEEACAWIDSTIFSVCTLPNANHRSQKAEHSQKVIGDIKVENVIGGMRGLKSMLWEASVLDPNEVSYSKPFITNNVLTSPWYRAFDSMV